MTISGKQISAARALLNKMLLQDLADEVGITRHTLSKIEDGDGGNNNTMSKIEAVLRWHGIEFIGSTGVNLVEDGSHKIMGQAGFQKLYDDIYETIKDGGYLYILNGVAENFSKSMGDEYLAMHVERMSAIADKIDVRAIVKHEDRIFFGADYAEYRWIPDDFFPKTTKLIYNGAVAFIDMNGDQIEGELYKRSHIAESEHVNFEMVWGKIAEPFDDL